MQLRFDYCPYQEDIKTKFATTITKIRGVRGLFELVVTID